MIKQIMRTALFRIGGGALNAEYKEALYKINTDNRPEIYKVLRRWYCLGLLYFLGSVGVYATIRNNVRVDANRNIFKGGKCFESVKCYDGRNDKPLAVLDEFQLDGQHKRDKLGGYRKSINAVHSGRGWACA